MLKLHVFEVSQFVPCKANPKGIIDDPACVYIGKDYIL